MLEYTIIRKPQRKRIGLFVLGSGKVEVRAPLKTTDSYIELVVRTNEAKLRERIGKNLAEHNKISFSDGATIGILDKDFTVATAKKGAIEGNILYLPEQNRVKTFYKVLAEYLLPIYTQRADAFAGAHSFPKQQIVVMRNKSRWGYRSSKGVIGLHLYLAFLGEEFLEVVIAHEYCHTRHMNHGKSFRKLFQKIMPDCREREKKLKTYHIKCYDYEEK